MIRQLRLTGFGKFRNSEFNLSPVTLVFGPNEAGKTTFFDGLFQALCKPSETRKSGKVLKNRYGSVRQASVLLSDEYSVSEEEFMNLYAIREGDLRLELDKTTDWIDKLKARLFHGGLDPSVMAAEFEKRSSDSRTLTHNKDLEKFKEAASKARLELVKRHRERSELLAKEKSLADSEAVLGALRAARIENQANLQALEKESAREERIFLRQKLNAHLATLESYAALEREGQALSDFSVDRRNELAALVLATRTFADSLQAERGRRAQVAELLAQNRMEARGIRETVDASRTRSAVAKKIGDEIHSGLLEKGAPVSVPVWCWGTALGWVALGGFSSLRFAGYIFMGLVALALILAVATVFLGIRVQRKSESVRRARRLAGWKDEWTLVSGSLSGVGDISTLEGFRKGIENCLREKEVLESRELEASQRVQALQDSLNKIDSTLTTFKGELDSADRQEREWLQKQGVTTSDHYNLKMNRYQHVQSESARRRLEVESMAPMTDMQALRRDLNRKLQILDEEGVPEKGLDDAAMQRIRRRKDDLQAIAEDSNKRERELIGTNANLAGEIRGTLGKLAGEIVEWEDRLGMAEKEILAKETDKKAAALAMEIFREIGSDANSMWAGLAHEIEAMLGNILPGGRTVSLLGLEDKNILVRDAGGQSRSLDQISTGTKHAMVLAAKLAMALRHRPGPGILVLDEPFLAMDHERETRALNLLHDFHERHGWQIILLTKEAELKDKMRKIFTDLGTIDLALPN